MNTRGGEVSAQPLRRNSPTTPPPPRTKRAARLADVQRQQHEHDFAGRQGHVRLIGDRAFDDVRESHRSGADHRRSAPGPFYRRRGGADRLPHGFRHQTDRGAARHPPAPRLARTATRHPPPSPAPSAPSANSSPPEAPASSATGDEERVVAEDHRSTAVHVIVLS